MLHSKLDGEAAKRDKTALSSEMSRTTGFKYPKATYMIDFRTTHRVCVTPISVDTENSDSRAGEADEGVQAVQRYTESSRQCGNSW